MTMTSTSPVLVLGGLGMLGHQVVRILREEGRAVVATHRRPALSALELAALDGAKVVGGCDAVDPAWVAPLLDEQRPSAVVNCVGIIKQVPAAQQPVPSIRVNALFPHLLADACVERGIRMLHVSTDCVFSGEVSPAASSRPRPYREDDLPDPVDLYGRSKLLGEVDRPGCLTLRTSLVGPELGTHHGLLGWALSQPAGSRLRGFRRALFSGLTTPVAARLISSLLDEHRGLEGVRHVAGDAIDKHAFLRLVDGIFELGLQIDPFDEFVVDRRLDDGSLRASIGWSPPSWSEALEELAALMAPRAR